jgi:hypothetical protein
MFNLFGSAKLKCPRCHLKSSQGTDYCAQCGYALGGTEHTPALQENRFLLPDDEVALFFEVEQLSSLFTQRMRIPNSACATIFQNGKSVEISPGDFETQGISLHLASLIRAQPADILVRRHLPSHFQFAFNDLLTAEFMAIAAKFSVNIKIENVNVFARCFMGAPGAISNTQLQQLLEPTVREIVSEFIGAQSLREMQGNRDLRNQLDERLSSALSVNINQYGLVVTKATTLAVWHDKLSAEREKLGEKIGTLWLVIDAKRALIDQGKRLGELYSEKEWQKITHEEEQIRLRYRREEMRQKFGKDLGWLYLHGEHEDAKKRLSRAKLKQDENERLQTIRARELELYGRIIDANTRKEAVDRGAGEAIKELEHTFKDKSEQRQNATDQWLHVRTLARIKMRTESEITQLEGKQSAQHLQQRISHQLQQTQLQHQMAQAQLLDDQTQTRADADILRKKQEDLQRHEQELAEENQKNRLMSLSIETEAKAREFQRMQAWEEELHTQKTRTMQHEGSIKECDTDLQIARIKETIGEVKRAGTNADALAQHEKLLRTLEVQAIFEKQTQQHRHQAELDHGAAERMKLKSLQDDDQCRWQRELEKFDVEHTQELSHLRTQQEHEVALARIAIERINVIANLSETGKIATTDAPNAMALADILKLQAQSTMSAEQILATQAGLSSHAAQAMSAMASTQQGMTSEQAIKMLRERMREDREHNERQAEQERRHQIDLAVAQSTGSARAFNVGQSGQSGKNKT